MEKKDKTKVKAVFDYMKKVNKSKNQTIELYPGVKVKVEYDISFDGRYWDVDFREEKIIVDKNIQKIFNVLNIDVESYADINYDDIICLGEYEEAFTDLATKAEISFEDWDWFNYEALQLNWTDWWAEFSGEFDKPDEVKYQPITLNYNYKAIIDKKNQSVKVGCQTIPIAAIRNLITEYDKEV